jgi:hypothetical protein
MSKVCVTFDGDEFAITDKECQALAGKAGLVLIPSLGQFRNISGIKCIVPPEVAAAIRRLKSSYGTLHDGTPVVRKFGLWVSERNDAALSSDRYPEVAKDLPLLSRDEWAAEILPLPTDDARKSRYLELASGMASLAVGAGAFAALPPGDV